MNPLHFRREHKMIGAPDHDQRPLIFRLAIINRVDVHVDSGLAPAIVMTELQGSRATDRPAEDTYLPHVQPVNRKPHIIAPRLGQLAGQFDLRRPEVRQLILKSPPLAFKSFQKIPIPAANDQEKIK
jgi:hypothetical protein